MEVDDEEEGEVLVGVDDLVVASMEMEKEEDEGRLEKLWWLLL